MSVPNALQLGQMAMAYGVWADTLLFGIEKPTTGPVDWAQMRPEVRERMDVLYQIFGRTDTAADVIRVVDESARD